METSDTLAMVLESSIGDLQWNLTAVHVSPLVSRCCLGSSRCDSAVKRLEPRRMHVPKILSLKRQQVLRVCPPTYNIDDPVI